MNADDWENERIRILKSLCLLSTMYKTKNVCIEVYVGNKKSTFLVDTGASISLIERNSLPTNTVTFKTEQVSVSTALEDSSCKKVELNTVTNTLLNIADRLYISELFVVKSTGLSNIQGILGLDFLIYHNVKFEAIDGVIRFFLHGIEIPWFETVNNNISSIVSERPIPFMLSQNSIESNCLSTPLFKVSKEVSDGSLVCVRPYRNYEGLIMCGLTEVVNNEFRIPVFNFSNCGTIDDSNVLGEVTLVEEITNNDVSMVNRSNGVVVNETVGLMQKSVMDESKDLLIDRLLCKNAPSEFYELLKNVLTNFQNVVAVRDEPPGRISTHPFRIDTGDHKPIKSKQYRTPVAYQNAVENEVNKLLDQGIIRESDSPWSSPVVCVKKKDGSLRLCIDYRKLNKITVDDNYPLPSMEELLVKVSGSKYFSTLDLKSGYHQIPVEETSIPKTAFVTNDKLFEYLYLPFGCKTAPAHFSRVMQSVLRSLVGKSVLVYLDDIIVIGDSVEEHLKNLIDVLDALERKGLKIKLEKCKFFQESVQFLGHIVSAKGIMPCWDKVEAIRNFPRPKTVKDLSSFLGLASYYRKFIKNFSDIARPLDALKKSNKLVWTTVEEEAFEKLKSALSSDKVLAFPKFDRPFLVTTDASNIAIGGVISQLDDYGIERPICFASRALKKQEKNYSTFHKEALAILWMLERHRFFLLGNPIVLKSDHRPLRDLFDKQDLGSRQSRWIERLLEFNIKDFEFIAGKSNVVADSLSRNIATRMVTRSMKKRKVSNNNDDCGIGEQKSMRGEQVEQNDVVMEGDTHRGVMSGCPVEVSVDLGAWDIQDLLTKQNDEGWIRQIKDCLKGDSNCFPSNIRAPKDSFLIEDNVLYQSYMKRPGEVKFRVVLPTSLLPRAISMVHSNNLAGHLGVDRTLHKARDVFYYPGIKARIREYINSCHICNCMKSHKLSYPEARKWPVIGSKFFRVHMDLVGPLPIGKYDSKYICVFVDSFTRYTFCQALEDKSAIAVANAFANFIYRFGCPRELISDNGREFINSVIDELTKQFNVKHFTVQAYRPSANGLVESHNKEMIKLLKSIVLDKPNNWVEALPCAEFALNTAYNRSIKECPFFLVFGQDPLLPFNIILDNSPTPLYNTEDYKKFMLNNMRRIFKLTEDTLVRSNEKYKKQYDVRHRTGVVKLEIGDRVYLQRLQPRKHKLQANFSGPYRILELKKDAAILKNLANGRTAEYHLSFLKKAGVLQDDVDDLAVFPRLDMD